MNRSTKLLMMSGNGRHRRVGVEYEDWKPESRFRDHDGREHYDNGRFAPRNDTHYDDWLESRRRDGRGRFVRSEYDHMDTIPSAHRGYNDGEPSMRYPGRDMGRSWYDPRIHGADRGMRMIGFSPDGEFRGDTGMDASYRTGNEMEYRHGAASSGYSKSQAVMPLDRQSAMEWVNHMENADGTTGPHWTMEKAEEIRKQHAPNLDPLKFWVALNMMYSDYCKVAEKLGVSTVDFFASMAKAFLDDKDAQPEKLARYWEYIAEG